MFKRMISLILVFVLLVSAVPVPAFAQDDLNTDVSAGEFTEESRPAETTSPSAVSDEAADPLPEPEAVSPETDPESPAVSESAEAVVSDDAMDSAVPAAAAVASGTCGSGVTWTLEDDGTLTIDGSGAMEDYERPWDPYASQIDQLVIRGGVTHVGSDAFSGLRMVSVVIEDGVQSIGSSAFSDCYAIETLSIADSVSSIGSGAFSSCMNLGEVTLPKALKTLQPATFIDCPNLETVICQEGLTEIMDFAFCSCSNLKSITLPDSLTYIGESAFDGCSRLTGITIPSHVTLVIPNAFDGCSSLSKILVSADNANYASDSTGVLYDRNMTSIIRVPEGLSGTYRIPEGVTAVSGSDGAFTGCSKLTAMIIPDSVAYFDLAGACSKINAITFMSSAPELTGTSFQGLTASVFYLENDPTWTSVIGQNYGGAITWVPYEREDNPIVSGTCGTNLTWKFNKTSGVLTISGTGAMESHPSGTSCWSSYAKGIQRVVISDGVTTLPGDAFSALTAVTHLQLGMDAVLADPALHTYMDSLKTVSVSTSSSSYSVKNSILFSKDLKSLYWASPSLSGTCSIPSGVAVIGANAFSGCTSLTGVTIPDSVKSIETGAFSGTGLTSVVIPGSVAVIPGSAFASCTGLTSAVIGSGITRLDTYAFSGCSSLKEITLPASVAEMGAAVFSGCSALTTITFEGKAPSFDQDAFSGVTATIFYPANDAGWASAVKQNYGGTITWMVDPSSIPTSGTCGASLTWNFDDATGTLTISGTGAMLSFSAASPAPWSIYSSSLKTVTIGDGVTTIGNYAFADCTSLTSISLPGSLNTIAKSAFQNCSALTDFHIADIAAWLSGNYCRLLLTCNSNEKQLYLNNQLITDLVVPNGVTAIPASAFAQYSKLTSVTLPDSVTTIGSSAFSGCSNLRSVKLSADLSSISDAVFSGCSKLTDIAFPDSITSIGQRAFFGCSSLTGITLPTSLTSIGNEAFYGCTGLTAVTLPGKMPTIGTAAFEACQDLRDISVADLAAWTSSGICYSFTSSHGNEIWLYHNGKLVTDLVIPDGVTAIGNWAFANCTSLTTVQVPASVASIGENAFLSHSSATGINEITFLGDAPAFAATAFSGTTATAYYPANNPTWTSAVMQNYGGTITWMVDPSSIPTSGTCGDDLTWTFDSATGSLILSGTGSSIDSYSNDNPAPWSPYAADIKSIRFSSSINYIGSYAFAGCTGLTALVLPGEESLYVGASAFSGCSALKEITFIGSLAGPYEPDAFAGVTATVYFPAGYYWTEHAQNQFGNSLTWVEYGEDARKLFFGVPAIAVGESLSASVTVSPAKASADCTFTISDPSVAEIVSAGQKSVVLRGRKAGTTTVTATDTITGLSVTETLCVYDRVSISLPYTEDILINAGRVVRSYLVTPEESGNYVLITDDVNSPGWDGCGFGVQSNGQYLETTNACWGNGVIVQVVELTAGQTYEIHASYSSAQQGATATVQFRKAGSDVTSIDITETIIEMDLADNSWNYATAVIAPFDAYGDIQWTLQDPSIVEITSTYGNECGFRPKKAGTTELIATCNGVSDSVTIKVYDAPTIQLGGYIHLQNVGGKSYSTRYLQFTPPETGRYVFTVRGDQLTGNVISSDSLVNPVYGYGDDFQSLTIDLEAGVPFYLHVNCHTLSGTRTVNVYKADWDVTGMEVACIQNMGDWVQLGPQFTPSTAAEEIAKWEVSDPSIMAQTSFHGNLVLFEVYKPGTVTVTATLASGMTASCTLFVGECLDGHDFSDYSPLLDGLGYPTGDEYRTCGRCDYSEQRKIRPAQDDDQGGDSTETPEIPKLRGGTCDDGLKWYLDVNGTLVISGKGAMDDHLAYGQPWDDLQGIHTYAEARKIVIEEGVTSIGDNAFFYFYNVTEVELPSTLTRIGRNAFASCESLSKITIPKSVNHIEAQAFRGCKKLTEITFEHSRSNPLTIEDYTAFGPGNDGTTVETVIRLPQVSANIGYAHPAIWEFDWDSAKRIVTWQSTGNMKMDELYVEPANVEKNQDGGYYIEAGLELIFDVKYAPDTANPTVVWTILNGKYDDGEAVLVRDGVIVGTKPGRISVKAEALYGSCSTTRSDIIITEPTAAVSAISVSAAGSYPAEARLSVPTQMAADVQPGNAKNKNVSWSVINGTGSAVITEDGILTGTATGTVTVCAEAQDGSGIIGTQEIQIVSHVEDITILINGQPSVTSIGLEESVMLTADISPRNATNQDIIWYVENGTGKATVSSYYYLEGTELTGTKAGTITLTAYSADNGNALARTTLNVVGTKKVYAVEGGNIYYNTSTGSIIGVDYTVTRADIPSNINGTTITAIAPHAFTDLHNRADNLKTVTIPETVTYIGDHAFAYCEGLDYVTFRGGALNHVGYKAFYQCNNLKHLNIVDLAAWCNVTFDGKDAAPTANCTDFYINLNEPEQIVIPESVTSISPYAFYGCGGIRNLVIPATVTHIGDEAFYGLSNLETLTIQGCAVSLGKDAFLKLTSLKHATLPGELNTTGKLSIGPYGNGVLETLTLTGTTVTGSSGNGQLLPGRSAKTVILADTITSIAPHAFENASAIEEITFGSSIRQIGEYAFHANASLRQVDLPESVTSIGEYAFSRCYSLTDIHLPDTITSIGANCFLSSDKLQIIDLSEVPDVINTSELALSGKAILPDALNNTVGSNISLHWTITGIADTQNPDSIARIQVNTAENQWYLRAYGPGEVILLCTDDYTGAQGRKTIRIEEGLEIRGMTDDFLVSGKTATLTANRSLDNTQQSVTWSLRESDREFASISTASGKSTRLTAKTVTKAEEIHLTATSAGGGSCTLVLRILPKATGVDLFAAGGETPVGQTGKPVQTLSQDMHISNTIQLNARVLPLDAQADVIWKTSDKRIATVDENKGTVTLVKPGTVTITATTRDGTNKSASVKLAVTYLDAASKLTAAADVPAIGLQKSFTTTMHVYGTDKTAALNPAELTFTSSDAAMATVDEAGVITAGEKTGTVTITAAITGDPLNRKVSLKVKVIAAQTDLLILAPEAGEPAEILMLDANGDVTDHAEQAVKYALYLNKDHVKSGVYTFLIRPGSMNTIGEEMTLKKGSLSWGTTDSRIATVKENADGSATVTVKAKTDGACAITAVSKDLAKVESNLTIHVRDYAPRLETVNLTLNSNRVAGVSTGLVPSYGNEIKSVSLHEYDSKTRTYLEAASSRLEAAYADGRLTITHSEFIKNGTVKLLLKASCENGMSYEYQISLKVSNSLPAITAKQPVRFNLHLGSLAELTVTAKDTGVLDVTLDQTDTDSFTLSGFDAENGLLSLALTEGYRTGSKLDAKLDLLVFLEGYREPVRKTVTINTQTTNPSITIKQLTKFNLFYKDSAALVTITAKNLTVTDVVLKPESTASFRRLDFDPVTGTLAIGFTQDYIDGKAKLDTSAELLVYLDGYNAPISKNINISTVTSKPALSLSAPSSIINTALNTDHSVSFQILNKTEDNRPVSAEAISFTVAAFADFSVPADGTVKVALKELENGKKNSGGTATILVQEENWMQSIKLTHRVTVESRLPVASVSVGTMKLNRIFWQQKAETVVKLNQGNLHIQDVTIEPAAKENTAAWVEAKKIGLTYADGIITASIPDGENAPKNGNYDFRYVVTLAEGETMLAAKTFKVNVHSTVPGVKLKTGTLKLNTALQYYGETAQTTASLTNGSGYTLVGFQLPEGMPESIRLSFREEDQTLSAHLADISLKTQNYGLKLTPVLRDNTTGQEAALPNTVNVTVQVHKTLPNPTLKTGTLKLNRIFSAQTAETAVSLNLPLAEIDRITFEPAAKENSNAWVQAKKIHLDYADGMITASIPSSSDVPNNGNYDFRYTVHLTSGTALSTKTIRINVHSTVPGVKLKTSNLKLNKVFFELGASAETAVTLTNGTGYRVTGFKELEAWDNTLVNLSYDAENSTLKAFLLDGSAANKRHSFKLTPIVLHEETAQAVALSSQITVNAEIHSSMPAVKFSNSTLKVNRRLAGAETASITAALNNLKGFQLEGFRELDRWNHEDVNLFFDRTSGMLCAEALKTDAATRKHTFKLTPILRSEETGIIAPLQGTVSIAVQVYDAKPGISISGKGKLDTMDPSSAITYTVNRISNAEGPIEDVMLAGDDKDLFHVQLDKTGAKPAVVLTMAEGAQYATNKTYKLTLEFRICGQDVPVGISFKVSQSGLKFASVPTLNLYQFQKQPVTCMVSLTGPNGAKLENIELSSKTATAFLRAMGGGEMEVTIAENGRTALVSLLVKNPGYLTYGKNYTVYLDITPENNATNIKPTQLKLTVRTFK